MTNAIPSAAEAPWQAGLHSARLLRGPGFLLFAVAAGVVAAYYGHPPSRAALDALAEFRQRGGFVFSGVATMIFGGVLPFLFLRMNPSTRFAHPWPHIVFFAAYMGYKGIEIDLL